VAPGDPVKWGPAPPSLPPGAQAAILPGSPAKKGPFVIRLKFPAGYVAPPHRHSNWAKKIMTERAVSPSALQTGSASDGLTPYGSVRAKTSITGAQAMSVVMRTSIKIRSMTRLMCACAAKEYTL
jgi:hypothetical protein